MYGDRKGQAPPRKETVNDPAPPRFGDLVSTSSSTRARPDTTSSSHERSDMGVVIFIVLTVAIFAVLGLVQKLVEGL